MNQLDELLLKLPAALQANLNDQKALDLARKDAIWKRICNTINVALTKKQTYIKIDLDGLLNSECKELDKKINSISGLTSTLVTFADGDGNHLIINLTN
jgi:hypothetical protein